MLTDVWVGQARPVLAGFVIVPGEHDDIPGVVWILVSSDRTPVRYSSSFRLSVVPSRPCNDLASAVTWSSTLVDMACLRARSAAEAVASVPMKIWSNVTPD